MFDNLIGISEDGAVRAKQEAIIMSRIAELRKEGLWSAKRLPKVQEPPRSKAHWDYLLEEMVWLATDFAQERKWKKTAAKKCARMVMKYHQDKCMQAEKAEREEVMRLRRIATAISREIRNFWSNVEKLVEYRQQTRLEEKRKKALDLHLNFIVDQTEKFSSWLAAGLSKPAISTTVSVQEGSDNCSTVEMNVDSKQTSVAGDIDFEPQQLDASDDEETIAKDEELYGTEGNKKELDLLKKESNMPLVEVLGNQSEVKDSQSTVKTVNDIDGQASRDDEDYKIESAEEEDDEETIAEQEKQEKNIDYSSEIKELEDEANMSVDDLREKYKAALESSVMSDGEEGYESTGESDDEADSNDDTENEDAILTNEESDSEELGMESLLDGDSESNEKPLVKVSFYLNCVLL